MEKLSYFVTNLRLQVQNIYFFYLLFSILSLILSKKMCKWRRKLRNAKIYPLEVQTL